jgi:TolB-like protein/Tfp pilus assembly protein PilF
MKKLVAELSRRNVFRMAALYGVAAWMILSIADIVFGIVGLPDGALRLVFYGLLIGFPVVLVFSWIYELTPEGLKREIEIQPGDSVTEHTGHRLNVLIGIGVVLVLLGMVLQHFIFPANDTDMESGPPENSIAVLPFVNMSADPEQEYFSDGLSEELLNLLAKIPELQVTSRTSAFAFKGEKVNLQDMAMKLNVANVLEGSIRKSGDQVRITAQLIEARSDKHLWSETYDRSIEDVFAVQDEIAAEVVRELQLRLLEGVPKSWETSPEVFELYLQGKAHARKVSEEGSEQAIAELEAALAIDPEFAPAWAELGNVYRLKARMGYREEHQQTAREYLLRALEIDDGLQEAWAHLADIAVTSFHFEEARDHLDKALALGGNNELALRRAASLAAARGDLEGFFDNSRKALAIDPLGLAANWNMGLAYYQKGEPEKALEYFDEVMVISPGFDHAPFYRGLALLSMGETESALEVFQGLSIEQRQLQGTALAYHDLGMEAESTAAIDEMEEEYLDDGWWVYAALVRAHRGEADRAFELLEIAFEEDHPSILNVARDPLMKNLHSDPRWPEYLEKVRTSRP